MIEIGSADAPVILGVSPHSTPFRLWAEKTGLLTRTDEPSEIMEHGDALEGAVLDLFAKRLGLDPAHAVRRLTGYHPELKWMRATPDGIWLNEYGTARILVEVKCIVGHTPSAPRVEWVVQALHQRLTFEEAERQYIVAFGSLHLEYWEIPYHPGALARVRDAESAFLALCESETPPPIRAADAAPLAKRWPLIAERVAVLGPESVEWDAAKVKAGEQIRKWEAVKDLADAHLRAAIGDAGRAVLPNGVRYTARLQHRKAGVTKAGTSRPLRRTDDD